MASSQKDAIEQLRARVEDALCAARENPLWNADLEKLKKLVDAHEIGTSQRGWKNPYPKDDPRSLLLEYQFRNFHDSSRFKASLQSRQTGKDFTHQGEIAADCYARPGADWMIAAPSERQALDSLEQGKMWAEAFGLLVDDYREEREGSTTDTLLKSAEIKYSNGSRVRGVPGRPSTTRGRSVNVLLTEFDFFEDPQATWRAIFPSLTNPLRGGEKKMRIATTPNGKGGAMWKIWDKPNTPNMPWSRHLVTIYHAVLMGLPVDVRQIREAMDDPDGFDQEYLCQFLDASNVLLPYDVIQFAESFEATEMWDFAQAGGADNIFCGIDFGRSNDPTVCWTLQRVGDILWTREVLVLENWSTPAQEEILRGRITSASRVCFDYTGPGIGLGDYIVREHGRWRPDGHEFGKVELCTFTSSFKREIFPKLRRQFETPTTLRIPVSTTIREDLHAMQQVITNGEYSYWSPRTRLGHSDRCTALALAVRAAGRSQPPGRIMPFASRRGRAHEAYRGVGVFA